MIWSMSISKIFKSKITIGIVIIFALGVGGYFIFSPKSPTYKFITVENGSITESVSLTGNTTPNRSVSLAFGSSGIISHTYSDLGKKVSAGQILAEENMSDLLAQLHNAQAGLIIAEQNTSTSENNIANVTAQQNILVKNAHANFLNSTFSASPIGSSNSSLAAPSISGAYVKDIEGTITFTVNQAGNGGYLVFSGIATGTASVSTTVPQAIGDTGLFIEFPSVLSYVGTTWTIEIPNKNAPDYLANYNAYQLALQTRDKAIADAQASTTANNTDTSSVAEAQITQAQATIDSINAKIQNARIVAPISGTITQFDAKVGQLASLGVSLISIMSSGGYEVDAGVSETDIGKVAVGNKVIMTLDAFPNETFAGSVFYIAPAATNTGGIINYQIKISFDKIDARLKSGLTANIDIETKHKDNVLVLPQYAILQNDQGTFVETLLNKKVQQIPVTLGIADQKGNVEVISGVSSGEQVLNIGLKTQ